MNANIRPRKTLVRDLLPTVLMKSTTNVGKTKSKNPENFVKAAITKKHININHKSSQFAFEYPAGKEYRRSDTYKIILASPNTITSKFILRARKIWIGIEDEK